MNLRDFIASTPEPDLPVIRYDYGTHLYQAPPANGEDLVWRELRRVGTIVQIGVSGFGFRRFLVAEGDSPHHLRLLDLPLRWEGDDS